MIGWLSKFISNEVVIFKVRKQCCLGEWKKSNNSLCQCISFFFFKCIISIPVIKKIICKICNVHDRPLVRKDMVVNEHERLSNFTLRCKLK
jgi:hypothetical protein